MKPIKIINKLNESVSLEQFKQFPDWIIESLLENDAVTFWYCEECNEYFKEPYSERTNMEDYYGVASEFPDHHYQDLIMCPKCKGGLEEKTVYFSDVVEEVLDDAVLHDEVYERLEAKHPDIVGNYYREQGTHHCDILNDHPEYADDIIKEMVRGGMLKMKPINILNKLNENHKYDSYYDDIHGTICELERIDSDEITARGIDTLVSECLPEELYKEYKKSVTGSKSVYARLQAAIDFLSKLRTEIEDQYTG